MPAEGWRPVHCNEQMLFLYRGGQHGGTKHADYWLRRKVTLTGNQRCPPALPVSGAAGDPRRGTEVCRRVSQRNAARAGLRRTLLRRWRSTLGDAAKDGENLLVLRMDGEPPVGPVAAWPAAAAALSAHDAAGEPPLVRRRELLGLAADARRRADLAGHARRRSQPPAQDDGDDQHARHVHRAVRALRRLPARHRGCRRLLVPDDRRAASPAAMASPGAANRVARPPTPPTSSRTSPTM